MSSLQFLYRVIPSVLHIHVVWSTWTCIQPAGASLAALPSWDDIRYVHRLRLHVNGLRSRHHSRLVNTWFMHCGWLICYLHFLAVCHIWNVNPHSKFIGLTMPVTYTRQTISTNLCGPRDRSPICWDFHVFPRWCFGKFDPVCIGFPQDGPRRWLPHGNPSREASFMYGLWDKVDNNLLLQPTGPHACVVS